jgi:ectoine hydroxylase-related dioxygenase (phytanoyl-CoA dioxygenase family)
MKVEALMTLAAQLEKFGQTGYVIIPDALSVDEVAALNRAIDEDVAAFPKMWQKGDDGRVQNANVLLSTTAFDSTIRHPSIRPLVDALLEPGQACWEEFSVMLRGPWREAAPEPFWHRDCGHLADKPYGLRLLQVVFYLTDVDEGTHSFGVVPESVEAKKLLPKDRDGSRGVPLYGNAGTAIVYNAGGVHAAVVQQTERERRTIHTYYGHLDQPAIGHSITPRRLFESADPDDRRFYSNLNTLSELVLKQR